MAEDEGGPPSQSLTTAIDPAVIRRASRRLFWLRTRLFIAITVSLAVVALLLALAIGARGLELDLAIILVVAFPLVWLLRFWLFLRHAERSFADFYGEAVTWRFEPDAMAWESPKMQGRLAWSLLKTLYLWPEAWVLHYRNNSFNVVPAAGIGPELREVVRAAASRHGGKVVEDR